MRNHESLHILGTEPEALAFLSEWERRFYLEKQNSEGGRPISIPELGRRFGISRNKARGEYHRIENIIASARKGSVIEEY